MEPSFLNIGAESAVYLKYAFSSLMLMPHGHLDSQKVVLWYLAMHLKINEGHVITLVGNSL